MPSAIPGEPQMDLEKSPHMRHIVSESFVF